MPPSPLAFLSRRSTLTWLRFGSEILGKLPRRGDSIPELLAKTLALADSAQKVFGARDARYRRLTEHGALHERTSETFTRLFFATALKERFALTRTAVDEHLDFVEAQAPDGTKLVFQERRYGSTPEIDPEFFHSPAFDFKAAVDLLWASAPHGLLLGIGLGRYGYGRETTVSALPPVAAEAQSRKARERLASVVAAHRLFVETGIHRTYLLVGPRGTGKTSFATHFARAFEGGGRLLQLDAASLPLATPQELGFLLDILRPAFLVVNDLDRAPIEAVSARMLFLLEMVKASHRETTVVLTVNDPTKLDSAMLRSQRIDIPVDFNVPDAEEREELLKLFAGWLPPETTARLVAGSAGWTHAYVVGLSERLNALHTLESPATALAAVKRLWDLAEASEQKDQGNAAPSKP